MRVSKIACSLIITYLLMVNPVYSRVRYVKIVPERPFQGDVVKIVVNASPSERVKISISFEKIINISNGMYEYKVYSVKVPLLPNRFTVTGIGVRNLYVSARIFLFFWATKGSKGINGVARVSHANVLPGTYDIVIHGEAIENSTTVKIITEASTVLMVDENGYLKYSYDTDIIPPGKFVIKVGDIIKNITLYEPLFGLKD